MINVIFHLKGFTSDMFIHFLEPMNRGEFHRIRILDCPESRIKIGQRVKMTLINTGDANICVSHANLEVNNGSGRNNLWRCEMDRDSDFNINGLALECTAPKPPQ